MAVPTTAADLSTTASSNSPAGSESIGTSLDDYMRAFQAILKQENSKGTDITSASSISIPNAGRYFVVTGVTTIATISDAWVGRTIFLKFSGVLTLTNSSGLVLPGGTDITTAAGDVLGFCNESSGVWRCTSYQPASGYAFPSTATLPTGTVFDYVGTTAPSGYVLLSGRTIGDGSSSATERANADTVDLYTLLWNSMSDTEATVSGGRGVSAAADFAAHKAITLPDARGRVIAGKDNMGGSTASRITNAGAGIVGTTLGVAGGAQTHTLITAELASHSHVEVGGTGAGGGLYGAVVQGDLLGSQTLSYSTLSAGSGNAHNNTQPTLVLNKIIKL